VSDLRFNRHSVTRPRAEAKNDVGSATVISAISTVLSDSMNSAVGDAEFSGRLILYDRRSVYAGPPFTPRSEIVAAREVLCAAKSNKHKDANFMI
jgi:hypothetical protein